MGEEAREMKRTGILTLVVAVFLIAGGTCRAGIVEAVIAGDVEKVEDLLTNGADPNAKGKDSFSLLHFAARHGHAEVAKLLIEHGADVNDRNRYVYTTPLHEAAANGHAAVAKLLLEHGARTDVTSYGHETPFDMAVANGHAGIVGLFIEHGADVNTAHRGALGPLQLAARNGQSDVARLLLDHGANVNLRHGGPSALHVAALAGHTELAQLLGFLGLGRASFNAAGQCCLTLP